MDLSRRAFLQSTLAGAALTGLPFAAQASTGHTLKAQKSVQQVLPDKYPPTDVWSYNGQIPGPVLRVKQGETFSARFENGLDVDSSIHWHGIRVPNNMDGVPFITQDPVKPNDHFDYQFVAKDAGTFWYHPHLNSAEQVDRGLSGVLIVEEADPIDVDAELIWMLDDWRLGEDGKLIEDYQNLHDKAHGGRLGNVTAVNGSYNPTFDVENGARVRLRLINSSNARLYTPIIPDQSAWVIAFDGQPITPKKLEKGMLRLGPGMRADIIVDISHGTDTPLQVLDQTYRGDPVKLAQLKVKGSGKSRTSPPPILAPNPLSVPDLANAERKSVVYEGGAMGRLASAKLNGTTDMPLRDLAQQKGLVWATNGNAYASLMDLEKADRLFKLNLGKSYIFSLTNKSAWIHPIHLHGHTYQLLSRNGKKLDTPMWQDTVLIYPNETVEVAFVADNPGDWMFHCHILDHAASGMIAAIAVG